MQSAQRTEAHRQTTKQTSEQGGVFAILANIHIQCWHYTATNCDCTKSNVVIPLRFDANNLQTTVATHASTIRCFSTVLNRVPVAHGKFQQPEWANVKKQSDGHIPSVRLTRKGDSGV